MNPHCKSILRRYTATIIITVLAGCLFGVEKGWPQTTRIYGTEDQNIPLPALSVPAASTGQTTTPLFQLILQTLGASVWQGFQATGTITYSGSAPVQQGSASLTVAQDGSTRLDVVSSVGDTSLRIHGRSGTFQDAQGKQHPLQVIDAQNSLFPYPLLLSPAFSTLSELSMQTGTVQLGSSNFDKVSLWRPAIKERPFSAFHDNVVVTDHYFYPTTHFLYKSADFVRSLDGSPQRYLRVITYADYRLVGGVQLPFRYSETINGEPAWTLQLQQATPGAPTSIVYYSF